MRSGCRAFLAALLLAFTAHASETNHLEQFQTFFSPLLQGEWNYHTRMTGPDGKVTFDGNDRRTYRLGVRGRFLIEDVHGPGGDHVGVQLYGLHVDSGMIHVAQYWSWQPTRLGDIAARLESDDGSLVLVGRGTPAGQDYPKLRFRCRFASVARYECETDAEGPGGKRWRANVETLTRLPAPLPGQSQAP